MAKITERCEKNINNLINEGNKFLMDDNTSGPYNFVLWEYDWSSIHELYLAYKSLDEENEKLKKQLTDITLLYQEAHDYIADFEESEDRCATLEAENNRFRNTIKNMNENFREHLNALEAENHKLKDKVSELHTIKKSFEVLRALYLGDYENDEPF